MNSKGYSEFELPIRALLLLWVSSPFRYDCELPYWIIAIVNIISSCSRCSILANYLATLPYGYERLKSKDRKWLAHTVVCLRCPQNLKFGDIALLFCWVRQTNALKCVSRVHGREIFFSPLLSNNILALWCCLRRSRRVSGLNSSSCIGLHRPKNLDPMCIYYNHENNGAGRAKIRGTLEHDVTLTRVTTRTSYKLGLG